jgi:protein O-GlcNAc transferase
MKTNVSEMLQAGVQAFNGGRYEQAANTFSEALKLDPLNPHATSILGLTRLRQGDAEGAIKHLKVAIALRPGEASDRLNLAMAMKTAGRRDDAISALRETLKVAPGFVDAHLYLGKALHENGALAEAAEAYRNALSHAPRHPQILVNLGNLHRDSGNLDSALESYQQAVDGAPELVEALTGLGSAALASGQVDRAIRTLMSAVSLEPTNTMAMSMLTAAHAANDRAKGVEGPVDRLSRESLEALYANIGVLQNAGYIKTAVAAYEDIVRRNPDEIHAQSQLVFMSNYDEVAEPQRIVERAAALGRMLPREGIVRPSTDASPARRLRVGLVSDDLRDHVVRYFLLSFLGQVNQSQFELFAYSSAQQRDKVTDRYRGIIRNWCDADAMSDVELANIAGDRIDILIDLGGHTYRSRVGVFARRPAPVQATWLGYSGTTGVAEIDYVFGDRIVTPAAERDQFTETIWPLPDSYLCYAPLLAALPIDPPPALASGRVTFGSFNYLPKVSDAAVALWSKVLHTIKGSRLLLQSKPLSDPRVAAATATRFARHGIGEDRLILRGFVRGREAHLLSYREIDIALDPFPYNGTTTTAEALWMGVPVLTRRGDRFIAHVGESMLTTVGLPGWIARDDNDFVRKAVSHAGNLRALAKLRSGLRTKLVESPLCDGPRFARNFEAALRGMWQAWCSRQATLSEEADSVS